MGKRHSTCTKYAEEPISDEIHSDLVYPGLSHIPFASLGAKAVARTITLNSATKSFNIPGLRCAVMNFGTESLKHRFETSFPSRLMGSVNALGIDATVAAWNEAEGWLAAAISHLGAMRARLSEKLTRDMRMIRFHPPEGTYLAWLDCSALGIEGTTFDFFHDKARVAFSPGENFSPGAEKFIRLNFATSAEILDEILERMKTTFLSNAR